MFLLILFFILPFSTAVADTSIVNATRLELTTFSFNVATDEFLKTSNFVLANVVYRDFIAGPVFTIDYHTMNNSLSIDQYGFRIGFRNFINTDFANFKADLRYLVSPGVIQSYQRASLKKGGFNLETLSILELSDNPFWYTFNQLFTYFYKDTLAGALVFEHTLNKLFAFENFFIGPGIRAMFDTSDILLSVVFGTPQPISIINYLNVRIF